MTVPRNISKTNTNAERVIQVFNSVYTQKINAVKVPVCYDLFWIPDTGE